MEQSVQATESEIEQAVNKYGNMLFRTCLVLLCNEHDAEDAVQDTIIKYITKSPTFHDSNHEKAWLLKVATNRCKNMRRFNFMHQHIDIDDLQIAYKDEENYGLLDILMKLPYKLKVPLLLFYVEGYKVEEIAEILDLSISAVKKRLQRGRDRIRERYREENEYGF